MIAERYGGKRAACMHLMYGFLNHAGWLRCYKTIEWRHVRRLVFVCTGNISRSPYAEARSRALGAAAVSFGLASDGRSPCDATAIRIARERGIDLTAHRSRTAAHVRVHHNDLFLAMEPQQARRLRRLTWDSDPQISLLGLWAPGPRPYIHDPFGHGDAYYRKCFEFIDSAIQGVVARLIQHVKP